MDLDGDGRKDMISGSYWPGEIWLFRGLEDATFARGEAIQDAAGKALHAGPPWKDEENPEMDSLAAAPFAHDHDGDGDLDLLVGNIEGRVILIRNDGTPKQPVFGKSKEAVQAAGEPIEVPGDAGPSVADWDQDGKLDLVVGAGDGSVWWFRNSETNARPLYSKGVALLTGSKVDYENLPLAGSTPERPGMRTKPCVADYDGDGLLDLLVGDYASQRRPEPKLTREQEEARDRLRRRRDELSEEYQKLHEAKKGKTRDDPELTRVSEALGKIFEELSPLEEGSESHGWVWLYRRKPKGAGAAGGG